MTRALLLGAVLGAGCGGGGDAEREVATLDSAAAPATVGTTAAAVPMPPQDAEHEFLRMMSDHHQGLVVMGEEAMNRATDDSVKTAAHNLHTKQAAQQDTMVAMIQEMYGERHQPTIIPKNAAQADSLRQTSGVETDRYFLRTTIAHHQEGIAMIDRFMPRFTKPEVRQMAERMRAGQEKDIQELQGKLSQL